MKERIPEYLARKIKSQAAYIARGKMSNEAITKSYHEAYGKYTEAIMDSNGTVTDHYIDKEAYKQVAAMRGIEI